MYITLIRLLKTAKDHIIRNGWLSIASVAIMTLTFVVVTVFLMVGFTANAILKYYQTQYPIIVFFNPTTADQNYINDVKTQIQKTGGVQDIQYTSQAQAYSSYVKSLKQYNAALVEGLNQNVLPPSLTIKAKTLGNLDAIYNSIVKIQNSGGKIDNILYYPKIVASLKKFIDIVQIVGISLVAFLAAVSFIIVLITIGITINSHATEIEIMQLVGAGRNYIRLPYIIDGAFYGAIGALLSAGLIYGAGVVILKVKPNLITDFLLFFRNIPLPQLTFQVIAEGLLLEIGIGMLLGILGSVIAISNYLE